MVSKKKSPAKRDAPISEQKCELCGKPAEGMYALLRPDNIVPMCKSCARIEHASKAKIS
ncbi:MAG: hypothetical protein QXK65_02755 [Candidatus Micrarchaeaceae archaeon]